MSTQGIRFPAAGELELFSSEPGEPGAPGEPSTGEIRCTAAVSLISIGTELACLRGQFDPRTFWEEWVQYPFAPGYSMVSRVDAVGPGVEANTATLAPGDRVFTFTPHVSHFTAPAAEAVHIPDGVSDDDASWASLAVTTQWALRRAGFVFGETAAVIGLGLLGQLLVRYLSIAGARRIVAIDTDAVRLAQASAGGADEVLQCTAGDAVESLGGAFDVVFDVTGHPAAFGPASELVRALGRLVLVGDAPRPSLQHLGPRVVADGISIIGVHAGTAAEIATPADPWSTSAMLAVFFDYLQSGRMTLAGLVTDRITIDTAPETYRALERDRSAHLGMLIDWNTR